MKLIAFLILSSTIVLLTGCPKGLSNNVPNKKVVEVIINRYISDFKSDETSYYCFVRGYNYLRGTPGTCDDNGKEPNIAKYENDAKIVRKKITESFITNIDNAYEQFINDLQTRRSTNSFLADITELGVGTAIGITNGERAIQILGVALTAFRGGRKSVDLNFYQQQSTPILITKMDGSRARIRTGIVLKRDLSPNEYSLEESLGDVLRYFWAGTLTRAFVELNKDAGQQTKEEEQRLEQLTGVTIDKIPTVEQAKVSRSVFEQIRDIDAQAKDAAKAVQVAEDGTDEEKAEAKTKQEKIRAILIGIWEDIEAEASFSPAIEKIKEDETYAEILGRVENSPDKVTEVEFLKLIRRLSTTIKTDLKLRETFLEILNEGNK